MAEYAAYLINRLEVGKDGKTAYERCSGKQSTVMAIEFGEKLLWKARQKNKLEKLNPRWEYGVFVGVATKEGLQAVRSVRRLSVEERWSESNTEFVRHVPWNKSGEDPDADGELPEAPQAPSAAAFAAAGSVDPPREIVVNTKETAPGEFCIKKKDVEAHGHTKDCPGCRTMFQGGTRQAHTLECRERFQHLIKDEEKVLRTREKRKEYEEKMEEETRRLETKKQRKEEAEKRGKKREAGDDVMEEEEPSGDAKEARGEKRKAEGDEMELERSGGQAELSGKGMAIEAVTMNDEEGWDDVRGGWLDRDEVREARLEEVGYMERKKALGRSVEKRRVGPQFCVCEVGGHQQRHRGESRDTVQARGQGLPRLRQGSGGSFRGCSAVGAEETADVARGGQVQWHDSQNASD